MGDLEWLPNRPVRIVFLDFDGVLNSTRYAIERNRGGILGLDPKAGALLEDLARRGRADVVVSSTWRLNRMRTELRDILRGIGYTGRVLGKTPDLNGDGRGLEIDTWLRNSEVQHPVESFVILDDDSDMAPHETRHVKTDSAVGLTADNVEQALAILEVR